MERFTLGLDYGTNSVRGLIVNTSTGEEVATSVYAFPSGEDGILLSPDDPNLARQSPTDYILGFTQVVQHLATKFDLSQIVGIGVDTTGSSPIPVDHQNQPLSNDPRFKKNLAAHCWLWKDHTSHLEASEITALAKKLNRPYLAKCGGTYSSEWFWSKIFHCLRTEPDVFAAADSWVECCDWIPAVLSGIASPKDIKRSRCAAGHKAMFSEEWGGLPDQEFLNQLDPRLGSLRPNLYSEVYTSDQIAGSLSQKFAQETGLNPGIPIAVGAFDAHFGAVASGVAPGTLVKIIGTSTCDCMVHPLTDPLPDVPGMCGIVQGSIVPGMYGLEAGQSAVGDIFNWVSNLTGQSHEELTIQAESVDPGQSGLLALDWHNGNRTILVDPLLSGLIIGLNLHTKPGEIYRACIESTAFGALRIIDRMQEYGVKVERVVACGGIADKSELTMQIYADILNRPVSIAKSDQTCALGAAMFAAVVSEEYSDVCAAQMEMTGLKNHFYAPNPAHQLIYKKLYALYCDLHDAFGRTGQRPDLNQTMKTLISIREAARG